MKEKRKHDLTLYKMAELKGSDRIDINNLLSAVCVTTLSLLLAIPNTSTNPWTLIQISTAIPLLVTSSLTYSKIRYRNQKEYKTWDNLGWITHTLGYTMILNAVANMLHSTNYSYLGNYFILTTIALIVVYTTVDITLRPKRFSEKLFKLALYLLLFLLGYFLPNFILQ